MKKNEKLKLHRSDKADQTFGCKYSCPNLCKYNGSEVLCALVRKDNICKHPPSYWKKLYLERNKK